MSWSFDSGHLVLDFVNTLEWRGRESSRETLNSYSDLFAWARQGKLINESDVERMELTSKQEPENEESALQETTELREALYRIFSNVAIGLSPNDEDLEVLSNTIFSTMMSSKLRWDKDRLTWSWRSEENLFDRILWMVTQDAVELLTTDTLDRVGECADESGCAFLFIDTTRNHSRKWCSMESCGNRAKARKHYERMKKFEGV